jgi:hypothetical protein
VSRLIALLLLPLLACGGRGPAAPSPEPITFAFHFTSTDEQAVLYQTWDEVVACVGAPLRGGLIRVTVDDSTINCADDGQTPVPAWGCTFFQPSLSVFVIRRGLGAPYHVERHELIHALLYLRGEPVRHANPAFARCDQ